MYLPTTARLPVWFEAWTQAGQSVFRNKSLKKFDCWCFVAEAVIKLLHASDSQMLHFILTGTGRIQTSAVLLTVGSHHDQMDAQHQQPTHSSWSESCSISVTVAATA